jgi:hypothetical protein
MEKKKNGDFGDKKRGEFKGLLRKVHVRRKRFLVIKR